MNGTYADFALTETFVLVSQGWGESNYSGC